MSFWTKYSNVYTVTQNNLVLNDNIKIDDESHQFGLHSDVVNERELDQEDDEEEKEAIYQSVNEMEDDDHQEQIVADDLIFESGLVRAWRYDEEQGKWRGRGKGNLVIYKHGMCKLTRLVFKDVKHENKIRLLQHIDASYTHCENVLNEVEWRGSDYSMDPHEPLNSLWKIRFIDEPQKIGGFISIFNNSVDLAREDVA